MLNDVYTAGDDRCLTVAIGLDISAAFDTIIHDVLIDRRLRPVIDRAELYCIILD